MRLTENQSRVLVFSVVALVHFILNLQFSGPVYLHDEIGYLANAAFLSGDRMDAASSYHAGYSLFLAPAFLLFSDPVWLWKAVVASNALISGATFLIAYEICAAISPQTTNARRVAYTLICALYPAYLTTAGYAFSQPAMLLVFMFAAWCLIRAERGRPFVWSICHSAACGFLFWIHPTGLVVSVASIVVLALRAWKNGSWQSAVIGSGVTIALVVAYGAFVGPGLIKAMTPQGYLPDLHYPMMSAILKRVSSLTGLADVFVRSLGVAAYLTIASLGFAFWGAVAAFKQSAALARGAPSSLGYVALFCLLSLAGSLPIGAVSFPEEVRPLIDTFFYGRYAESVLLPILLMGLLFWEKDRRMLAAAFTACALGLLALAPGFLAASQPGEWRGLNFINASGLWTVALPSQAPVWGMFAAGALAVAGAGLLGGRVAKAALVVVFLVGSYFALQWHRVLYPLWGTPGSLPALAASSWPAKTCVGIDPDVSAETDPKYRLRLLRYYLHGFNLRRTSKEEWLGQCDGPLLTFRPDAFAGDNVEIIAKEKVSGLALVARKGTADTSQFGDLYTRAQSACLTGWCFDRRASEINSQIGTLRADAIKTTGNGGFLLFGPYISLAPGKYTATIDADIETTGGGYVDAVASAGKINFGKIDLPKPAAGPGAVQFHFTVTEPVDLFELRLFVGPETKMSVSGYVIERSSS